MSKILILANSSGGIFDFRGELLSRLISDNYEVVVSLPDDVKVKEIENLGCRVVHTDINRRGVNPKEDLKLIREYKRLIKSEKPDVVLTYTIKPNIYGGYACRKLKVHYISTITGLGSAFQWSGLKKKLIVFMYKAGLKKCDCVFFQNEENMRIFKDLGISGKKSRLVNGSGVNLVKHRLEDYPGHKDDITRFLYIGRIMKEKGSDEYLYAARKMKEKYGDKVSVAVLGYCDDDYEEKLKEAEKQNYLKVIPFQKDVHPYIKEADAIVMPSYHEGMSNVVLEASATGRPVLASDISGCREGVEHMKTGLLFQPRDKDALFNAMDTFIGLSISERFEYGKNARLKMEKEFDRQKVIEAYLEEINCMSIDYSN